MSKDDSEDGGGGRTGRVRKKSAKVLEMEEFEQAEKTATKKPKGNKPNFEDVAIPIRKPKPFASKAMSAGLVPIQTTPVSSKVSKVSFKMEPEEKPQIVASSSTVPAVPPVKSVPVVKTVPAVKSPPVMIKAAPVVTTIPPQSPPRKEDPKSVIKHLLNPPTSGTKPAVSSDGPKVKKAKTSTPTSLPKTSTPTTLPPEVEEKKEKKISKKPKNEDKPQPPKVKSKPKKMSPEIFSGSEDFSQSESDLSAVENPTVSLKMRIFGSSDPSTAQVSINIGDKNKEKKKPKQKKVKRVKHELTSDSPSAEASHSALSGLGSDSDVEMKKEVKKPTKKVHKKKEKLIIDAISAAQRMPSLGALESGSEDSPMSASAISTHKVKEKKKKSKAAVSSLPRDTPSDVAVKADLSLSFDEDEDEEMEDEEVSLVIAEGDKKKKKKKTILKKKGKEKEPPTKEGPPKGNKRAPTAYMLFCNSHRPQIVSENPGIDFAAISRKLGELWQTLSNKKKLLWRKKATRRSMKNGSNFISTGKPAKKGPVLTPGTSLVTLSHSAETLPTTVKLTSTAGLRSPRSVTEDTPQSPTRGNFSFEPIDVAAHLKLLGESLSIIGMRLQEHKGMIAVQGSLSVLLDSLLCACGPLLCLTQQVPGMDGCPPSVHVQTLDSVAYIMPGL